MTDPPIRAKHNYRGIYILCVALGMLKRTQHANFFFLCDKQNISRSFSSKLKQRFIV